MLNTESSSAQVYFSIHSFISVFILKWILNQIDASTGSA